MRRVFETRIFKPATVEITSLDATCDVDKYGNAVSNKRITTLKVQLDREGNSQQSEDNEAQARDRRVMAGHVIEGDPRLLTRGLIGRIEFEDGSIDSCKVLAVSQSSLRVVKSYRIRLLVGAGAIERQQ